MPPYVEVAISVKTPRFNLELAESDPATATADDQDVQGALLLGKLADAVLRYFGHTDAFAQYVEISKLLSGEESAHQGTHVRRVRELLADAEHLRQVNRDNRAALARVMDPDNWMVDLVHDPVGAVNQVDSSAPPRSDTYRDTTSRHDGATALPAMVLGHAADRLKARIDDIIDAARGNDLDAVMTIRKIIQDTMAAETEQAAYRTRARLRNEPVTPDSPALFEQDRT